MARLKDADTIAKQAGKAIKGMKFTRSGVLTKYLGAVARVQQVQAKDKAALSNALKKLTASQLGIMMVASGALNQVPSVTKKKGSGSKAETFGGIVKADATGKSDLVKKSKTGVLGINVRIVDILPSVLKILGAVPVGVKPKITESEGSIKPKIRPQDYSSYDERAGLGIWKMVAGRFEDTTEAIVSMKDDLVQSSQAVSNDIMFGPFASIAESLENMVFKTFKNIFGIGKEKDEKRMRKDIGKIEKHMKTLVKDQKEQTFMMMIGNMLTSKLPQLIGAALLGGLLLGLGKLLGNVFMDLGKMVLKWTGPLLDAIKHLPGLIFRGLKNIVQGIHSLFTTILKKLGFIKEGAEVAGDVAKAAGKGVVKEGAVATVKAAGKGAAKTIAKETGVTAVKEAGVFGSLLSHLPGGKLLSKVLGMNFKVLGKKIPGFGLIIGLALGISRFMKGDVMGGILEIVSGLTPFLNLIPVPGLGTGLAIGSGLALDATIVARDIMKAKGISFKEAMKLAKAKVSGQELPAENARGTNLQQVATDAMIEEQRRGNDIGEANNNELNVMNNNISSINNSNSNVSTGTDDGDIFGTEDMLPAGAY